MVAQHPQSVRVGELLYLATNFALEALCKHFLDSFGHEVAYEAEHALSLHLILPLLELAECKGYFGEGAPSTAKLDLMLLKSNDAHYVLVDGLADLVLVGLQQLVRNISLLTGLAL